MDKYVPNIRKRPLRQRPTPSPMPSVSIPILSPTLTNLDKTEKEQVPMKQSNTEVKETKFEATVYQTLLKILQGINCFIAGRDSVSIRDGMI